MKIIFNHNYGFVKNERVFCEVYGFPDNETYDELLDSGWLPSMEDKNVWYQSKSCRINNNKIVLSNKRKKILSQLKTNIFNYIDKKTEVDLFFANYFKEKNFDLFDSYNNNSSFGDLKIMEVKFDNEVVAYNRFREFENVLLGLEISFIQNMSKFSLGKDSILLLSNYGKTQGKNYLYIYESYKNYFPYKLEIIGVEYWEGEKWITP